MSKFLVNGIYFSVISEIHRTARTGDGTYTESNAVGTIGEKLDIPGYVTNNGISYKVVEIGTYSFVTQSQVRSITVSKNIEIIKTRGLYRFTNCDKIVFETGSHLTRIEAYGIYDSYYLQTLEFNGNCLQHIGSFAMQFMIHKMKNLTFPSSLLSIEAYSLGSVDNLEHLYYCGDNQITGASVFSTGSPNHFTPTTLKIHTKSTYNFQYFAERKVTNKDADEYCKRIEMKCPVNQMNSKCVKTNPSSLITELFYIFLVILD